jgi:hypothetical protein
MAYNPIIMLAILFLSYCEGETSSRKIEEKCKRDMYYIYISAGLYPDHCSISRFRKKNLDLLAKYFVEILRIAKRKKISEFQMLGMDGSKIQARSSKKKSYKEKGLENYISEIELKIQEYLSQCEAMDEKEGKKTKEKIEVLRNKQEKLKKCKDELIENKKKIRAKDYRENHQINIVEPEAKMMMHNNIKATPSYNAQIVVDMESGIIASNDVVQERNDEKQFKKQYTKSEEILGKEESREYVADGGYGSFDEIKKVEEENIDAYIGVSGQAKEVTSEELEKSGRKIDKKDFKYNKDGNFYECPGGNKLEYISTSKDEKKDKYKFNKCSGCKLLKQCHGAKAGYGKYKIIMRDKRKDYVDVMREKVWSKKGREMMLKRQHSVESVFGNLKWNLGFTRFSMFGLESVKGEFNLMCIAHNINKLFLFLFFLIFRSKLRYKGRFQNNNDGW